MHLNLTEFGRRIGKSRTTVRALIESGIIQADIDPANRRLVIDEREVERYLAAYRRYTPAKTEPSQCSQGG